MRVGGEDWDLMESGLWERVRRLREGERRVRRVVVVVAVALWWREEEMDGGEWRDKVAMVAVGVE